jgi:hypothetical protein
MDHHHFVYPTISPEGIYFKALVERAFKQVRQPFTWVKPTKRNAPRDDLMVGEVRLSLKTETGSGAKADYILITKLLSTERPWGSHFFLPRFPYSQGSYPTEPLFSAVLGHETLPWPYQR